MSRDRSACTKVNTKKNEKKSNSRLWQRLFTCTF